MVIRNICLSLHRTNKNKMKNKISDKVIKSAGHYLTGNDDDIREQIQSIVNHRKEGELIDDVNGISVWQPVENSITCKDFLDMIGYHLPDNSIEEARETLRKAGYAVDNLWCNDDVKAVVNVKDGEITDEACQEILNGALKNDATMEQIWLAIKIHAENEGLNLKED